MLSYGEGRVVNRGRGEEVTCRKSAVKGYVVPCLEGDKINSELFGVNFSLLQSHFLRDASCQAEIQNQLLMQHLALSLLSKLTVILIKIIQLTKPSSEVI